MKILITNDDGISAPGIAALVQAFAAAGHEVYVSAPDAQRSAASHSMTLTRPLRAQEAELPGAARAWAVSGTPVDCVKLALSCLCPQAEAVISGVNHGYNAGTDVLYSGTVAAAMEGALYGLPAMAVSLKHSREDTYGLAAALAAELFPKLLANPLPPRTLLNVNYPGTDRAQGVRSVPVKAIRYDEYYTLTDEGYMLRGSISTGLPEGDDDYTWLERGYATVTALGYDLTDHAATHAWKAVTDWD